MTPMQLPIEPILILWWVAVLFLACAVVLRWRRHKMLKAELRSKQWGNYINGNEVHTVPIQDLMDHTWADCACSPQTIPVETDEGTMNWQVIHSALDGRK